MKKPRYLGTPKRKIATPVLTCIPLDFTWNKKKNTCKSSHLWHFDLGAPTKSNPNRYSGISVQFSQSVMSDSLWSHGLQLAKLPCPSPPPKACSNSYASSCWCRPTISSYVVPFSSSLQSFPAIRVFSNESILRIKWPKC